MTGFDVRGGSRSVVCVLPATERVNSCPCRFPAGLVVEQKEPMRIANEE